MSKERELDELFARVKSAPAVVSFEETKTEFMKTLSVGGASFSAKLKGFLNTKNLIIMISIASIISVGVWLLMSNPVTNKPTKIEKNQQSERSVDLNKIKEENSTSSAIAKSKTENLQKIYNLPVASIKIQEIERKIAADIQLPLTKVFKPSVVPAPRFYFPTLTEKEITDNHKQKKKMMKAFAKFDSKTYSYIPAGSFDYNGSVVSVHAFFIQQTEVSNIEYRTFLFDLIIQGRKEEFLIAQPDQDQWVKVLGESLKPMQNMYFSHEAYNNYPVVNVSRKGAEMYCEWLTKETKAILKQGELMNDARIPTRFEWVKAASYSGESLPFPWGTNSVQNQDSCFLANFDSSTYSEQSTCKGMEMKGGDGGLLTVKTTSYNPNYYGLYNMSGNVAEMVNNYTFDDGKMISDGVGTAGGGWMNTVEEIKIYGPDPYKDVVDAHPGIGFRVVVTHLKR